MSRKIRQASGKVSISILEALSEGLYENILDVLREYIQNTYDAIDEKFDGNHSKGIIKVIQDRKRNSLIIHDNGIGMDADGLENMANIGFSTKKKKQVGFRGIGSLAGFTVAEKVIFISKTAEIDIPWMLTVDAGAIMKMCQDPNIRNDPPLLGKAYSLFMKLEEAPSQYQSFYEKLLGPNASGTTVILENVNDKCGDLLRPDEVEIYIARRLPVDFDPDFEHAKEVKLALKKSVPDWSPCVIELNGKSVYKVYYDDLSDDDVVRTQIIRDSKGEPLAFVWFTMRYGKKKCEKTRGLVLVVKGFTVLDAEQTITKILQFKTTDHGYWVTGEIHTLSDDVVPTTSRGNLKDNQAKRLLLTQIRPWSDELQKEIRNRSSEQSGLRSDKRSIERIVEQLERLNARTRERRVSKADLIEMQCVLEDVETRTRENLASIDNRRAKAREELEKTLEWIEGIKLKLKGARPVYAADELNLAGVSRDIYNAVEHTILKFPFQNYSKEHQKLRADLTAAVFDAVKKKRSRR